MAIPSTDWVASGPIGMQPVTAIATTAAHPLGFRIRAKDVTYGEVELVYLPGVASTAAGDLVAYDEKAGTTARAKKGMRGPLAVAMGAAVAGYYGWYAVEGSVPVLSTALVLGPAYLTTTAGSVDALGETGERIDGMSISGFASGGYSTCKLNRPTANGGDLNSDEVRT